ncbi:unnamed protein product [Soboliphyme baturini]|uniref:Recombinase n=1 Tax=Soboliphyme baturini TaxID=241478 RepID=A0A183IA82_9BILA|nr:unnamed protein product [Soboliphyme baturini]
MFSEYLHKLNDLQNAAKAAKKGKWLDDDTQEQHVRNVVWTLENRRHLLETSRREPIDAVVEYVRDGSTLRVLLLPSFTYVTVMITGIRVRQLMIDSAFGEFVFISGFRRLYATVRC